MPKGRGRTPKVRKPGGKPTSKTAITSKKPIDSPLKRSMKKFDGKTSLKERYGNNTDVDYSDYPCGICGKPVADNDEAILCDSGCDIWYHRSCTGMDKEAYELLTREDSAEWACDLCVFKKGIPSQRVKSTHEDTGVV